MPEQESPSLLDQAVNESIKQFWARESYPYKGHQEPNLVTKSAELAIRSLRRRTGIRAVDLALQLVESTTLTPSRVDLRILYEWNPKTWDGFFTILTESIVAEETLRRDPNIRREEARRTEEFI